MKKLLALIATVITSFAALSQNVGINTTNPEAALDVYGDVIFRTVGLDVADGTNYSLDIATTRSSYYRISGPTADFFLAGILAGVDGKTITLFNRSGFAMQLNNEDPFAALTEQIVTGTSADLLIANKGIVSLQYDGIEEKWIVKSSSKGGGGSGSYWDINGNDLFNSTSGNVGIGTSSPTTKLTMLTSTNTPGWTHIGDDGLGNQIIVGEAIGGVSAAIGTSTNHALRLTANGTAKMSIYPGGEIVIGDNTVGPYPTAPLTVKGVNNSFGIMHLGDNGNVFGSRMGGTSAGIGTFSNTNLRLFVNNTSAVFIGSNTNNVGIGIEFPTHRLEVNGTVRTKEVIVETINWPDYVFSRNYRLPSLAELEKFILQNKHLPNIPSAKEIEQNGLHLGDTQKKMMEKIEELSLYIIQLNKRIEQLERNNK
ncbi:MAG: hypothetical protein H7Y31_10960 [Chitinophagaceae bacterium]|nr:hypothetical protein [Chitinophagaceae bacterium]